MNSLQAIRYRRYGPPAVLRLEEAEKPVPLATEALIQIRAAALNPLDWHFLRGSPYGIRFMTGLRGPRSSGLGVDAAGVVESVGARVTGLRPGDAVFGSCREAFAEFACADESALVLKPENISFQQAAAVPVAAFTALQALRDKGRLRPEQRVLINGAAGGVGTFAVQIARWMGAEVTGVCSTRNVERLRSIGAHHVIDYSMENFTQGTQLYHLMLDCIGNHPLSACRRILSRGAAYVMIGAPSGRWIAPMDRAIAMRLLSPFVSQKLEALVARTSQADLLLMRDLLEKGTVTPIIDRTYPLDQVPQAIAYLEEGHSCGKVIITV